MRYRQIEFVRSDRTAEPEEYRLVDGHWYALWSSRISQASSCVIDRYMPVRPEYSEIAGRITSVTVSFQDDETVPDDWGVPMNIYVGGEQFTRTVTGEPDDRFHGEVLYYYKRIG